MKIQSIPQKFLILVAVITIAACSGGSSNRSAAPVVAPTESEPLTESIVTPTVKESLAEFPEGIGAEFANQFPDVTASEIFKRVSFEDNAEGSVSYGIEGLSNDEVIGIDAIFSADITLLETSLQTILCELPMDIAISFEMQYPDVDVEEIVQTVTSGSTEYSVLFIQAGEELEVNMDEFGDLVSLEDELEGDDIPGVISAAAEAQNVDLPQVGYESVTFADETIGYVVEYENDNGESISYKMNAAGQILEDRNYNRAFRSKV